MKLIKRKEYLKKLRGSYDSDLIKVITGMRRCGKSVLLMQIIEEFKERGIKESQIIYLNFENYDNIVYTEPKCLHNFIKSQIKTKDKYYLFFDEIQFVDDFERVINYRGIIIV